jgi:hypothetical protein
MLKDKVAVVTGAGTLSGVDGVGQGLLVDNVPLVFCFGF